jgi:two-component system OmpR family response regulator
MRVLIVEDDVKMAGLLRRGARRPPLERPAVVEVGDLRLDPGTRQVWRGDAELRLSTKEFALLETFMRRPGRVLSRYQLLEHCWDYSYENRSNVVDVYVRYLREKIDRPFGRTSLETVRGAGYRLRADGGR